jgi:protein-tyrosine phosphatase
VDGITAIAATPHVRDDWPTDASVMEERVAELRAELEQQRIPLDVLPGGEIALEWIPRLPEDQLRRFGLGGNPRYLLVETPYYGWPLALPDQLLSLRDAGFTPVLAHPERNLEVQVHPERLVGLVEAGVLIQVTAASVDGRIGKRARACAGRLLEAGLVHMIGSDAHHAAVREAGMRAAAQAVGGGALARWLTHDVPAAVVADTPIPSRPEGFRRRGGWLGKLFEA